MSESEEGRKILKISVWFISLKTIKHDFWASLTLSRAKKGKPCKFLPLVEVLFCHACAHCCCVVWGSENFLLFHRQKKIHKSHFKKLTRKKFTNTAKKSSIWRWFFVHWRKILEVMSEHVEVCWTFYNKKVCWESARERN